jgi:hypothetical protein
MHTVIAVGTLSAALLIPAVFGLDDLGSAQDVGWSVAILAFVGAGWAGTIDLVRVG